MGARGSPGASESTNSGSCSPGCEEPARYGAWGGASVILTVKQGESGGRGEAYCSLLSSVGKLSGETHGY